MTTEPKLDAAALETANTAWQKSLAECDKPMCQSDHLEVAIAAYLAALQPAASAEVTPTEKLVYEAFEKYSRQLDWGLTPYQPECWTMMDAAAGELVAKRSEVERLREALKFYADPDSYVAIGIFPDSPCGAFAYDFSRVDTGFGNEVRPGAKARAALAGKRDASE